jgi:hypothetical protein
MPQPVAILGMHRSGTSCLAGCLEDCGLFLGEVNREAPHNRKGNNENVAIRNIHDRVLARVGASWDNPPHHPVAWLEGERLELWEVIKNYEAKPHWGFKDPRSIFLLDGWLELDLGLKLVGTYRHPADVVASLERRNGFDPDRSLHLWRAYNNTLSTWAQKTGLSLIRYDAQKERYMAQIRRSAAELGLDPGAKIMFRDEDLNHHAMTSAPDSADLDLWNRLEAAQI